MIGNVSSPTLCRPAIFSFCAVAVLLIRCASSAEPIRKGCEDGDEKMFLWKIRGKTPSFLFGTIHVPYTRVWDSIPAQIKRAFHAADLVMVELNLSDPRTLAALNQCQLLPDSKKLRQVIPRGLFNRIKRHLDYVRSQMPSWLPNSGMSVHVKNVYSEQLFRAITKDWERKRPIWVMLMINSLTEHDIKSRGIPVLDTYLTQEAKRLKKVTGAVERVQEQCRPLNGLNSTQVLYILNRTMIQHEAIRRGLVTSPLTTDDSIRHYICGDFQSQLFADPPAAVSRANPDHAALGSSSTRLTSESPIQSFLSITGQIPDQNGSISDAIDSYFRSEMIFKRNQQMGRRIIKLLNQKPDTRFFFAFGAAHFLGNNSVISFVEAGGFRVVRVSKSKRRKKTATSERQKNKSRISGKP